MIVDWDDWRRSLERFSAATGLCVSAYDAQGERRIGPLHRGRLTDLLAASGVWRSWDVPAADRGPGDLIEADLVATTLSTSEPADCDIGGEIRVLCTPILIGGETCGALVYGWVLPTFGTPLGSQRLGRELGVDPTRLWAAVRLTPPVPAARMAVLTELLQTMVSATARHAEAIARLAEMSRLREVFLAGVSHELRTPLSAIGLRIEVLLRAADLPQSAIASLQKMKMHVTQQARLVDDLIEASRTRTGQLALERRPTALSEVLSGAVAAIHPQADSKGVVIDASELSAVGEVRLLADPDRLQQVFWNLLSNAVKFTPGGGLVSVAARADDAWLEIVFSDTGSGIDAAALPGIFEPFQRTVDGNAGGLGLGLAIARHIVEGHGGSLRAESAGANAGSRFVVRLPLQRPGSAEGARWEPPANPARSLRAR